MEQINEHVIGNKSSSYFCDIIWAYRLSDLATQQQATGNIRE